jgi:hypothetical protein
MRIISIVLGFVLLLGISVSADGSQMSTNSTVRLTRGMFTGYEFTLISDKDYTYYLFLDDKRVDASYGSKGGGVVALAFGWRIKDPHTLALTGSMDGTGPERFTMQFKSFGKKIAVTTNGDRYRRTKFKYPN